MPSLATLAAVLAGAIGLWCLYGLRYLPSICALILTATWWTYSQPGVETALLYQAVPWATLTFVAALTGQLSSTPRRRQVATFLSLVGAAMALPYIVFETTDVPAWVPLLGPLGVFAILGTTLRLSQGGGSQHIAAATSIHQTLDFSGGVFNLGDHYNVKAGNIAGTVGPGTTGSVSQAAGEGATVRSLVRDLELIASQAPPTEAGALREAAIELQGAPDTHAQRKALDRVVGLLTGLGKGAGPVAGLATEILKHVR